MECVQRASENVDLKSSMSPHNDGENDKMLV